MLYKKNPNFPSVDFMLHLFCLLLFHFIVFASVSLKIFPDKASRQKGSNQLILVDEI